MPTKHDLTQQLAAIETNAARIVEIARAAYTEIILLQQRLDEIAAAGMYTFAEPPLELWESRNGGEAKYLRLRFHETPARCPYIDVPTPYDGPNGQRQIYIGADTERIIEARARVARRNQWLDLTRQIDQHANTIRRLYRQLLP